MGTIVLWILAAMGAIALVALRGEISRAWAPGNRLQAATALILVSGGVLAQSNLMPYGAVVRQVTAVSAVALLLVIGLVSRPRLVEAPRSRIAAPVVWALVLWGWLFVVNTAETFAQSPETALARTISGLLLIALLLAQMRAPVMAFHFTGALAVVVPLLLLSLPFIPEPLGSCTIFKCSELGLILLGPFSSGNYFALLFAMMAALSLATIRLSRVRVFVLILAACGLYATNSRTSLFAVAAGIVIFIIVNRVLRYREKSLPAVRSHRLVGALAAIGVVCVGAYLLFSARPDSFSNRGLIWQGAIAAVGDRGVTGIGIDNWAYLQERGEVSYHFAHSQYMTLYFAGGFIALALFVIWIAVAVHAGTAGHRTPGRGLIVPLTFLILGLLEVVWNPLTVDGIAWIGIAVISASVLESPRATEAGELVVNEAAGAGPRNRGRARYV